MKYLKITGAQPVKILTGLILLLMASVRVLAAGTDAGDVITNAVTLDYQVSGIDQTQLTTSVDFTVDRALSVLVNTQDGNVVDVVPGQNPVGASNFPALNFDVTNTSNADVDLLLGLVDQDATPVTGFAGNAGPASFNGAGVIVAIDTNSNGLYDDGTDTPLAASGNHFVLPAAAITRDTATRIVVAVSVPLGQVESDQATYTLVAAVADAGAVIQADTNGNTSPGGAGGSDVADDTAAQQDLFADVGGVDTEDVRYDFVADAAFAGQDTVSNGQASDTSAFVVNTAEIAVAKSVEVLWDPISGSKYDNTGTDTGSNPKAIPNALLMYVIGVQNDAASSNTVTNVALSDDLPEGPGATGIIEGNQTGEPDGNIFVPATTSLDFGAGPVAVTIPSPADKTQLTLSACDGTPSNVAFNLGAGPEVNASVGTCTPGQTGVIVYFVTLQ